MCAQELVIWLNASDWHFTVNFQCLVANAKVSWRGRASAVEFARRLIWIYSAHLPAGLSPQEWTIGFRYPAPIGHLRLSLRSNQGADAFIHSEVFEHQHYRLPLKRAPKTILDLGANIGLSAVYFARLFPDAELACVEPAPGNVRVLAKNLALNGARATIISAAVDANDGRAMLELGERDYGHRIVAPSSVEARPTLAVETISVPTILRRLGWERIGLLKVDIEGHEAALFARDCDWLERVDAMCLEYHHHFADADLARIANQYGFSAPRRLPGNIWLLSREL